jgi:hypothetical protein
MTPTIVHRYAFPIPEAIEALLGDAVGDCEAWRIRIEGEEVVIDVVAPTTVTMPAGDEECRGESREEPHKHGPDAEPDFPADEQSGETSPDADEGPEPELKGGPLAQRAAICCGEKGFQTFVGAANPEEARGYILRLCNISSRKELDLGGEPARTWKSLEQDYRFWLGGGDVTAP